MIRFLLADRLGFSWEDIKKLPAHFVKQYINDIERSKNHFKGLNKGDAKKFSLAAQSAGIPVG
jgi:chloramphenicol O-acetyltransferase